MRVAIVGAGAIGSLFAFLLARGGNSVELVGRPGTGRFPTRVRVEGLESGVADLPARAALEPAFSPDIVLLTVKAGDAREVARGVATMISRPVEVVAMQNGWGIEPAVQAGLGEGGWADPRSKVVRAINSYGATLLAPGEVRYAGAGEILLPEGQHGGAAADAAADLFLGSGLRVRRVTDLPREIWRKLLVNASINPVTADHGVLNGALRSDPLRGQTLALLREAQLVARAEGYDFSDAEAEAELWKVVRATSENRSSMLQDIDHRRPTEVEWITGALVDLARRHGVPVPETERALARVRRRERIGPAQPS